MKWLRRILYGIGALLALVAIVGAGGYLWLRTSLPQTAGTMAVPGLDAAVEIARDGDGIVTIRAQSEADAFFALGFAHAQDRLFQMEMMRRIGAGRLSEIVGADTLDIDKFMRILGLYRLAEAEAAALPSDMRATVAAYAAGVNAFLEGHRGALPPEFALLRYRPEPWRPVDSLVWGKLMALQLSDNWSQELLRYRLSGKLSPERLNELWPAPPNDELGVPQAEKPDDRAKLAPSPTLIGATSRSLTLRLTQMSFPRKRESRTTAQSPAPASSAGQALDPRFCGGDNPSKVPRQWAFGHNLAPMSPTPGSSPGQAVRRFAGVAGDERGASNSFVVAGSRSAGGKPLLANDPHLGLQNPIQWYLVRIETPSLRLVGATAPGVPMLIIGHNGHVAWTFTTTHSDTQDLFLEKLQGEPARYLAPSGPLAFETRQEIVKVDGADDVALTVRRSRHGPILSDAPSLDWSDDTQALALAWPALETDDGTAAAFYRINRARNADELLAALEGFHSPMQNVVYADTGGAIGFIAAGRMPIRKQLSGGGEMPAPGWSGAYDWAGFLPFGALPQVADPPAGWTATANNDIRPGGYAHFFGARWEEPFRYRRIAELIAERPRHTAETVAAIQMDIESEAAREFVAAMLDRLEATQDEPTAAAAARQILMAWDFRVSRDQPAPLIFTAWLAELNKAVLGDELDDFFGDYARGNSFDVVALVAAGPAWCDDVGTAETETCAAQIDAAWRTAVDKLAKAYGPDPGEWRWGDAHRARFPHPLFDRIPVLRGLLHEPIAADGDNFTVNRATPRLDFESVAYPDVHGAGLRVVFDLADLDRSRFIIAGGQSGNPLSEHYGDQIERWRDGKYIEINGAGDEILRLVPGRQ